LNWGEPEYVKYLKFLDADCRPNDFDYKYEYDVTLQYGKDGNVVMTAYYKAWNKNSEGELELSFSYTGMFYFKDGKLVSSHEQKNGKRQDLGIIWYADGPLQPVYTTNAEIMYKKTLEDAPDVQAEEVAAGIDQSTPSSVLDDIARWGAVRDSAAQRKSTGSYSIQEPKLEPIELFK